MLKKLVNKILSKTGYLITKKDLYRKSSYSQCGEDLIVSFIFEQLKIPQPIYLDLGAHHPRFFNNTRIFYQNGSRGVNVEPDPFLINKFREERPEDINLNIGIGFEATETVAKFYVMSEKVFNTFSESEALRIQAYGSYHIEKTVEVPLMPINNIFNYFYNGTPNYISLDVESLDLEIIRAFDFNKYRPEVFCIETITYTEDNTEKKITEITDHMIANGYQVLADTFINTIFVDKKSWQNR